MAKVKCRAELRRLVQSTRPSAVCVVDAGESARRLDRLSGVCEPDSADVFGRDCS